MSINENSPGENSPGENSPGENSPGENSPGELVRRIQAGDSAAESILIQNYGRPVALLLDRQTNGRPEAEDLFQDTFRLAIGKLRAGELREPAKLPGFLARMARNLAIEHYRKKARRKTAPDTETVERASAGLHSQAVQSQTLQSQTLQSQTVHSQLGALLAEEHAALVRRLLQELPSDRDREILMRFYLAEEEKEIIARDLGLDLAHFNQVLCRARKRYKKIYLERTRVRREVFLALFLFFLHVDALHKNKRGGKA